MFACHESGPGSIPGCSRLQILLGLLTLAMLNKLRCHIHFQFSANQITWSRLLIQIQLLNDKQCWSRSVGFFRSQLIWIYTVCKGKVYPAQQWNWYSRETLTFSRETTLIKLFLLPSEKGVYSKRKEFAPPDTNINKYTPTAQCNSNTDTIWNGCI